MEALYNFCMGIGALCLALACGFFAGRVHELAEPKARRNRFYDAWGASDSYKANLGLRVGNLESADEKSVP